MYATPACDFKTSSGHPASQPMSMMSPPSLHGATKSEQSTTQPLLSLQTSVKTGQLAWYSQFLTREKCNYDDVPMATGVVAATVTSIRTASSFA
jgi:hypothetical protein